MEKTIRGVKYTQTMVTRTEQIICSHCGCSLFWGEKYWKSEQLGICYCSVKCILKDNEVVKWRKNGGQNLSGIMTHKSTEKMC